MIATTAPIKAVIPISKPFGCQITKVKVKRKITIAKVVIINIHLISHFTYTVLIRSINDS